MRADIFCRVIDNYGDIGVCWRLARQLAHGHGWQVRLWVDDMAAFARIEPDVAAAGLAGQVRPAAPSADGPAAGAPTPDTPSAGLPSAGAPSPRFLSPGTLSRVQGVEIVPWTDPAPELPPAPVVIEAFACDPPPAYLRAMHGGRHAWVNLEYLSAEPWVEGCHGLPSPQPGGLVRHFFFPGFTGATGGLLREPGLVEARRAWQADPAAARAWLSGALGVPAAALAACGEGARLAALFCYEHAPARELADWLAGRSRPTVLLVPEGVAPALPPGRRGSLTTVRIPFVPQPDFDRLLWSTDLNLVRGEDSFVRAVWAGRPLVWQIYPQDGGVHLGKLDAWLALGPVPPPARSLMRAWNAAPGEPALAPLLDAALEGPAWAAWQKQSVRWADGLARRPDLADALAGFCQRLLQTG